jgi:hypothetical protein
VSDPKGVSMNASAVFSRKSSSASALSWPRGSARLRKVTARSSAFAERISSTRAATLSSVHTSNERGTKGTSITWAMLIAARWLEVSRPPVSMMMSSYLGASLRSSVRTALPVSLMLV